MSVSPTARYPASRCSARRRGRHASRALSIAFLEPRIGLVVIAADLPVTRMILGGKANAREPIGALPEAAVGHQRAHGSAVSSGERLALAAVGHQHVRLHRFLEVDV